MNKLYFLLGLVAVLFLFGACSDDDATVASSTTTGSSGETVSLNGTWRAPGNCAVDGTDSSESETFVFSGTGLTFTSDSYWTVTDCSGDSQISLTGAGSFVLGDAVSTTLDGTAVTGAVQMDVTFSSFTLTPNSAGAATDLNAETDASGAVVGTCGITNWANGVAQSIVGTGDCVATSEKDLLYLDDVSVPDRLYGGDDTGVDTAVAYPTVLDTAYLERQ